MKEKKLIISILLCFPTLLFSQINPINFEPSAFGSNWNWTVFENDNNPPLEIVNNPSVSGLNTSSTVAKFTAKKNGQPWAGCESEHGFDLGSFSFDSSNCIVKIMVFKNKISDVGVKFVDPSSAAQPEIKLSNTVINQWEELTFDFSSRIGVFPVVKDQIVIFPDFDLNGRIDDQIIFFDNITFNPYDGFTPVTISWECINNICESQNNNSGNFSDSLSCANLCLQNSIHNYKREVSKTSTTNFLGQPVNFFEKNKIYFIRFNDGTVKKQIFIN